MSLSPPSTSSPSSSGGGRSGGSGVRRHVRWSRTPPRPHAHPMPLRPHVVPTLIPPAPGARSASYCQSSPPMPRPRSLPTPVAAPRSTMPSRFDRPPTPHPRLSTSLSSPPLLHPPVRRPSSAPWPARRARMAAQSGKRRWPTHPSSAASLVGGGGMAAAKASLADRRRGKQGSTGRHGRLHRRCVGQQRRRVRGVASARRRRGVAASRRAAPPPRLSAQQWQRCWSAPPELPPSLGARARERCGVHGPAPSAMSGEKKRTTTA
jgi:hypothetical protein